MSNATLTPTQSMTSAQGAAILRANLMTPAQAEAILKSTQRPTPSSDVAQPRAWVLGGAVD
jgi:hypothetical protein